VLINKDSLGELDYQFRTGYNEAFATAASMADRLATVIPITGPSIRLTGLKAFAKMRKWVGPRHYKNLEALGLTVEPELYEDTVGVPRVDIEDDTYGQIMPAIRGLGTGAAALDNDLVAGILQGSSAQLGYDGLALAADTHAMAGTTYDNSVTTALSIAAIKTAIDYFAALKDEAGQQLSIKPTALITSSGGSAYWAARKYLQREMIVESGVYVDAETYQALEHIPFPAITSATFWAVVCLTEAYKPVVLVRRTQPELTAKTNPDSDQAFNLDLYSWGTRYRVTAAPGPWQFAYCSTGAG